MMKFDEVFFRFTFFFIFNLRMKKGLKNTVEKTDSKEGHFYIHHQCFLFLILCIVKKPDEDFFENNHLAYKNLTVRVWVGFLRDEP